MPFKIQPIGKGEYKVTNRDTGKVYAYHTKRPHQLIQAVEINKIMHSKKK